MSFFAQSSHLIYPYPTLTPRHHPSYPSVLSSGSSCLVSSSIRNAWSHPQEARLAIAEYYLNGSSQRSDGTLEDSSQCIIVFHKGINIQNAKTQTFVQRTFWGRNGHMQHNQRNNRDRSEHGRTTTIHQPWTMKNQHLNSMSKLFIFPKIAESQEISCDSCPFKGIVCQVWSFPQRMSPSHLQLLHCLEQKAHTGLGELPRISTAEIKLPLAGQALSESEWTWAFRIHHLSFHYISWLIDPYMLIINLI